MNKKLRLMLFMLMALFVGFVNGLFGGGGGVLCVPILKVFLGLSDKRAHATSILIMAIISIPTLIIYITSISISTTSILLLSAGVILGGVIGSVLLKKLNNETINIIFALLLLISGVKMLF